MSINYVPGHRQIVETQKHTKGTSKAQKNETKRPAKQFSDPTLLIGSWKRSSASDPMWDVIADNLALAGRQGCHNHHNHNNNHNHNHNHDNNNNNNNNNNNSNSNNNNNNHNNNFPCRASHPPSIPPYIEPCSSRHFQMPWSAVTYHAWMQLFGYYMGWSASSGRCLLQMMWLNSRPYWGTIVCFRIP